MKSFFNKLQKYVMLSLRYLRGKKRLRASRLVYPYISYTNGRNFRVLARVMEGFRENDLGSINSRLLYFWNTIYLFLSYSIKNTVVRIRFESQEREVFSDSYGYISDLLEFENTKETKAITSKFLELQLGDCGKELDSWENSQLICSTDETRKIIISDIDDTIIQSKATSFLSLAFKTLFLPPSKRKSFPETAKTYRNLQKGASGKENNLMFYLSSSSWDIYPILREILKINEFPSGPLILQNIEGERDKKHNRPHAHKIDRIQEIIEVFPDKKMVLIGDAGQADADIYLHITKSFPNKVEHIYIRNVWWKKLIDDNEEYLNQAKALGVPMTYFDEWDEELA